MAEIDTIRVAIVFHSVTGTTALMAERVAAGIESVDTAKAMSMPINSDQLSSGRFPNNEQMQQLQQADAIVFGSPTFMGGPTAQFKAFADASSDQWESQQWANKLGGGFTVGANYCGDQLATIQYFMTLAGQHGMLWVGVDMPGGNNVVANRLGAQGGVIAQSPDGTLDEQDALLSQYLGKRVATLASVFKRGRL
jgi:multimeric flavodoxin WrbA